MRKVGDWIYKSAALGLLVLTDLQVILGLPKKCKLEELMCADSKNRCSSSRECCVRIWTDLKSTLCDGRNALEVVPA